MGRKQNVKILTAFLFVVFFSCSAYSQENKKEEGQDYKTGIGVRLGGLTSGITVKHFTNPTSALEGILGFGYRSFIITGLYEKHNSINDAPGLKWLYGIGAHVGFFRYGGYYYVVYKKHGYVYYVDEPGASTVIVGIDFILGLDYKFNKAPFNIGLDIKPFFDFFDGPTGFIDGALSIRYTF